VFVYMVYNVRMMIFLGPFFRPFFSAMGVNFTEPAIVSPKGGYGQKITVFSNRFCLGCFFFLG